MYYLNKIVWAMVNPFAIGMLLAVAGIVFACLRKRKTCVGLFVSAVTWLWFWSMPLVADALGASLEAEFEPVAAENLPQADAIVVLGGGMSAATNVCPYPNLCMAADRVWHAARLFKAGKAPLIVPSGTGSDCCEVPFLVDLGVPRAAIRAEAASRNTEENAKFVAELLKDRPRPKVLLVTSAWHMRRALLMYRRYAPDLEIVPAPADYENTVSRAQPFTGGDLCPDFYALVASGTAWKEILGYWWYKIARR
jgi:uncharacterized SAM-binding protein YcdF (DUF218 family)